MGNDSMTVRAACARVGAAILPAQVACCPPAVTVKATRDDVRHGVVVGGGPPPARCDPPSAARATHRAAPDVTLLQRQLSGLLDTTAMCARPDRAPGMLSTLFASTTSTVAALFDGLRTRATISRGLTAPTAVSTPTAPTEAPANGLPAVSMPPQPPLPPTGIQLFIAPPLASVAAPVAASDTSTAADTPTDGSFAAGVATWVASLPRPRIGDGPTLPIGELRRRLERWRAHHRLTRTGLLLLTIAAPVGVAFASRPASRSSQGAERRRSRLRFLRDIAVATHGPAHAPRWNRSFERHTVGRSVPRTRTTRSPATSARGFPMIVASPIAARMPSPAHAPGREPHAPEVQDALDRAATTLTDLGPAAAAFTTATREGHGDRATFGRAAIATNQLLDDIHTASIGRWPNPVARHAAAAELVGAMAGQLTGFGTFWSLPFNASKPLVNVRTSADQAAAIAQDPTTDFSGGVPGGALAGIANGMRYLANLSFDAIGTHRAEAGFLAAGVARTVDDAQQRLQDALNSASTNGPFRAARQAQVSAVLLDAALTEGSSLINPTDAARVRTAVDGVLQLTDPTGHAFPHGAAAFTDAVRTLKTATTPVLEQLDGALAPHLTGPDADALREWRVAPATSADGYYADTDFGFDFGA